MGKRSCLQQQILCLVVYARSGMMSIRRQTKWDQSGRFVRDCGLACKTAQNGGVIGVEN